MGFEPAFLDRLRAAVHVSEVISRKHRLRKEGGEFRAYDNHSLTCNDKKGVWHDFGSGKEGGDVFAWFQQQEGLSFTEAVEAVARIAGIGIPDRPGKGNERAARQDGKRDKSGNSARQKIVGTWDYTDADGRLLYQTVRVQWQGHDGGWILEKSGKPKKTFRQRRRSPVGDGSWINGLEFIDRNIGEPHEFMRRDGGDWSRYDPDNYRQWGCTERRSFPEGGNVEHTLLHVPLLNDVLSEERAFQKTIYIPEGEKKVDLLRSWGLIATTNSGGAKNWHAGMAKILADAADIVILEDNDDASRARTAKMAPMLIEHGCRVRVLSFPTIWPECPLKGDVVDWMVAGGTPEELTAAVEKLPEWEPLPYQSRFGAFSWGDHRAAEATKYEWLIKNLIPAGHNVLIIGPSGSGKSFESTSMALAVARGISYNGRKVKQAGVVYCNYEASRGMAKRLLAYERHHGLSNIQSIPFAWLTRPPGLFAAEENATDLAEEIKALTKGWSVPIGVIVVDTHNAATRGSSEIDSKDIGKIIDRYSKIQELTGASIWIIGHTNSDGKHRGNEQLYNGIETCVLIERITEGPYKRPVFVKDLSGRVMRRFTIKKQREGEDGITWDFVLHSIEVGVDEDGEPITSMVSIAPNVQTPGPVHPRRQSLTTDQIFFLRALDNALLNDGIPPPASLNLSRSIARVTTWTAIENAYADIDPPSKITPEKHSLKRNGIARELYNRWIISLRKRDGVFYVWKLKDPTKQDRGWNQVDELERNANEIVDIVTGKAITEDDL